LEQKGFGNMNSLLISSYLFFLGTVLITFGFGLFPRQIYTSSDIQERSHLLAAMPQRWVLSQSVVILGGLTTMVGSIFLIPHFNGSPGFLLAVLGVLGYVAGQLIWIWNLALRIVKPQKFAGNELPGWLYMTYSILTLSALAAFGAAFRLQGIFVVLGIAVFLAALLVLGLFLKYKDMPPIVYYAISLSMGLGLLF
jgi:hypothetical protein